MTALRLLLNSAFTGANAFFALADADGSLAAAGLELEFTPGRGAWTAAARLADGEFDLAYGDLNALVALAATRPREDLPKAVCVVHQHAPSVVAVARAGAIGVMADLAGKRIVGHASDVALQTFAVVARATGLRLDSVAIDTSTASMRELLQDMLAGRSDAVFGYATTHTAALAGAGLRADQQLRFLGYRDVSPALYGSALMASARLVREQPLVLSALVHVLRASVAAAMARPVAALDAVMERVPAATRAVEAERWQGTLTGDMGLRAAPGVGWGDFDDQRMQAGMRDLAQARAWPTVPQVHHVLTRRFLAGTPLVPGRQAPPPGRSRPTAPTGSATEP